MKIILKIVYKSLIENYKRTILTLVGVTLAVSMIAMVYGIFDSIMEAAINSNSLESIDAIAKMRTGVTAITCVICCFSVYSCLSISFRNRVKSLGFLTSVGMSTSQKSFMVLVEASVYAMLGGIAGTAIGFSLAKLFYFTGVEIVGSFFGEIDSVFVLRPLSVLITLFLGFLSVLIASFVPMLRMRRLDVTDAMRGRNKINISLRQGLVSRLFEKLFGTLGRLAGQNYDNNKEKYSSISFALSGGTTFFFLVYCFFMYPINYFLIVDDMKTLAVFSSLFRFSALIAMLFVVIFLICSAGSAEQNIENRKSEFAVYKSLGMHDSELRKMMNIECIMFTLNSAFYGFIGSFIADDFMCWLFRITGNDDIRFIYPIKVFILFIVLYAVAGFLFAVYSSSKIKKIRIIENIKAGI